MYQVKIKKLPNLPQARRGGSYLNYYQMAPSFTSGSLSDPELDYSQKLGPVDRDVANVEVEAKEKILMSGGDALGGMLTMYTAGGKRHAEGGTPLNLPEGAFVFSDFHGKDFRLGGNTKTKEMDKGILAYFGLPDRKGGYTFADIAGKYDINKDVANLMDPTEVKDKMTMDTLMYNIKNKTKKLGALAIAQESKKGEGAPKMAMPFVTALNMAPEDFDIPKISIDEMPFYQNVMQGAQQMDQQKAMMQQQQEAQAAGMDMQDQGQAPDQGGMEQQYAQDMGQYMQRMGGSSFPNPYYPGKIPDEMPQAMLGYQVFKEGGETGLDKFLFMAQKGFGDFDPDSIVNRSYNRRKGVYIYTDADGNEYETTQPDLAVAGIPQMPMTAPTIPGASQPTQPAQPTYDVPKNAIVVERKKDETDADWAKRRQEAYDKATDKSRVYIKSEDKYYKVGSRNKGYGDYTGTPDELKKVFNDKKDLAAMYQKLEETFKDPKVRAEYVKRVREAAKKDANWGKSAEAKGAFKDKVVNGTISDDQIVQSFLDHNKRNLAFRAHGVDVANTANTDNNLKYTNAALKKYSEEYGLPINKDTVPLEQLSYIGYRDLLTDRDAGKITDAETATKLSQFNIGQVGKSDEPQGSVSNADWIYTNTTAGQAAGINPASELYDEELKARKEEVAVPPGVMGKIANRPPAKPWLQNIMGTGMALTQDVNRYMPIRTTVPYIGQVDPQFISPIYQSQLATSTARGMMEGMSPYLGDQVASSRQSELYGNVAEKAIAAAAGVEQFNAGETLKAGVTNLGTRLQAAQAQAAADDQYYTNVVGSKAIEDKNLQLKDLNIYTNVAATLDNMARTDATNYVFGEEFNINGMNPFNPIQQIRGKSPDGSSSAASNNGALISAYQSALKNPEFSGLNPEDIKDLVIAEYNKANYSNAANNRKRTLANSIMGAYTSPVGANNPMMSALSAYTQGMNPYTNGQNDNGY